MKKNPDLTESERPEVVNLPYTHAHQHKYDTHSVLMLKHPLIHIHINTIMTPIVLLILPLKVSADNKGLSLLLLQQYPWIVAWILQLQSNSVYPSTPSDPL